MESSIRLKRDYIGNPVFPERVPEDLNDLLALMDDAANHAATAQGAGAGAFDHGMRVFSQLKAHYDLRVSKELATAHAGLTSATRALKTATWWLAVVTVGLAFIELVKALRGH